jgi:nucleoside-diphosphate-sugar epimerase
MIYDKRDIRFGPVLRRGENTARVPERFEEKVMQIALTGATGFLGRYIARKLAQSGHRLRCWCRPQGEHGRFEDVAVPIEWLPGELNNVAATQQLVRGADALVHAAVQWGGARNRAAVSTNLTGSLQLFQAAFEAGVPRCVFISSTAVHDVILGDRPLDETHPLWPKSHYGALKAALEAFIHSYGFGQGWPICALRPTSVYGVTDPPAASRWYGIVGQVLRGEPIASAQGGELVHAADVACAVELLVGADASVVKGQSYNCNDMYIANQEVARIARALTGSNSDIADLNRGPEKPITAGKLRALGMTFGGEALLRRTIHELIEAHGKAGYLHPSLCSHLQVR